MKLKNSKTITTIYKTENYEIIDNILLQVSYINGEITNQVMPCKIKNTHSYSYVKDIDLFKEECRNHHFYDTYKVKKEEFYWWKDYLIEDLLSEFNTNGIDENRLVIINHYDHSIRDRNNVWFDILVHSDYIGGFKQKDKDSDYQTDWKWKKLKAHLSTHPNISNFEEEDIPGYNSDYYGQKGLKFDYVFESSWRKYTETEKWFDCKTLISGAHKDFDPLNIKQFIKEKEDD